MKHSTASLALCSAVAFAAVDGVPEWVHLLPAGEVRTVDGRGPYTVAAMSALIAASLKDGDKLPIDENHATDKGAVLGLPAPARGWIVEMQARDDGLWGRVEWTQSGRQLMEDRAYSGISPAILHDAQKRVGRVLRASLTNTPNLQGLVSLHSEEGNGMDWKAKLIELLGLDSSADDAAINAALAAKMAPAEKALCAQDVLEHPSVIALQSQIGELSATINALTEGQSRKDAEAFVDGAIREGRIGVKARRDLYVSLHMQNPANALELVSGLPRVAGETVAAGADVLAQGDGAGLVREDRQVMALFSMSEADYQAELKSAGLHKEVL